MMNNRIALAPIVFAPIYKETIWGGDKIYKYKNAPVLSEKTGESWEISDVPGNESTVCEGALKGLDMTELIEKFGASFLGKKIVDKYNGGFPLLIKIIDANDDLSVQVHPDDKLAKVRHNSLGKTEMWYVADCAPHAKITAGLNEAVIPGDYEKRVADGSFYKAMAVHDSHPGDVFFLPAGRVHAIGSGNLIIEIQETSDITYRIYDYNRTDAKGNHRRLHTAEAKDAINFSDTENCGAVRTPQDTTDEVIVSCDHFETRKIIVDGKTELSLPDDSFTCLICVEGNLRILCPDGDTILSQGHSALLPAAVTSAQLEGKAVILTSHPC